MSDAQWEIGAADAGARVDAFLARRPEVGSRARASQWIERGKVFLNGQELAFADAGRRLQAGDRLALWIDRPGTARPAARGVAAVRDALRILHEDESILVADKPAGLLVEPLPDEEGGEVTLLDLVADHLRPRVGVRASVVHRIDRDTTGLVAFAKTGRALFWIKEQFEQRKPERVYQAVLHGRVEPASGIWKDQLVWDKERLIQRPAAPGEERAREAIARYRVLEQFGEAALVEVRLVTGKRNQIRLQAALRGHPLVGERLYLRAAREASAIEFPRQALHAMRLGFVHPVTRRIVSFTSPLPADMELLVKRLQKTRSV
jgi:23S rRNA pseudouridine1911/1915/1917 synthase